MAPSGAVQTRRCGRRRGGFLGEQGLGCYSQVLPLAADRLQLMNATVVGVEEVAAVRDPLRTGGLEGALLPARRAEAPTVLAKFCH